MLNQTLINALYFVAGVAAGSAVTFYLVKKKFEEKADTEVKQVIDAYNKMVYEKEGPGKSSLDGSLVGEETIDVKEKVSLLNNKPDILDYTKFFHEKNSDRVNVSEITKVPNLDGESEGEAEDESPEDDEAYSDEEDLKEQVDYENYMLNHASEEAIRDNKPPYEIDAAAFDIECAHYDKIDLIWYMLDDTLANEAEEIVDKNLFVGSLIEDSGFDRNDLEIMYVRNDKLMCDFKILKLYETFERK